MAIANSTSASWKDSCRCWQATTSSLACRPRADPWVRRFYGWGWNLLVNVLFGYTARDVDCAFKLFPRDLLETVKLHSTGHTLSPELLIKARRAGYRIAEVRVTHLPRTAGQAKGARIDHIVRSLLELAQLRLDLARGEGRGARGEAKGYSSVPGRSGDPAGGAAGPLR